MRVVTSVLLFVLVGASLPAPVFGEEPKLPAKVPAKPISTLDGWLGFRLSPDNKLILGVRHKLKVSDPYYEKFKNLPPGLCVWSTENFKEQWSIQDAKLSRPQFSDDGTQIVDLNGDQLRIWDAKTGKELGSHKLALTEIQEAINPLVKGGRSEQLHPFGKRFSPDFQRLVVLSSKGTYEDKDEEGRRIDPMRVRCWDTKTGKQLYEIDGKSVLFSHIVSEWLTPDCLTLIATSPKGIHLFDARTGKERSLIEGTDLHGRQMSVFGNNRLVVGNAQQYGVRPESAKKYVPWRLWDLETQKEIRIPPELMHQPIPSPDGKHLYWLVNEPTGQSLERWDITAGKQVSLGKDSYGGFRREGYNPSGSESEAFSPDSKYILFNGKGTTKGEGAFVVRHAASGKEVLSLAKYTPPPIGRVDLLGPRSDHYDRAMFLPGERLLSMSATGRVDIWSLTPKE